MRETLPAPEIWDEEALKYAVDENYFHVCGAECHHELNEEKEDGYYGDGR